MEPVIKTVQMLCDADIKVQREQTYTNSEADKVYTRHQSEWYPVWPGILPRTKSEFFFLLFFSTALSWWTVFKRYSNSRIFQY